VFKATDMFSNSTAMPYKDIHLGGTNDVKILGYKMGECKDFIERDMMVVRWRRKRLATD